MAREPWVAEGTLPDRGCSRGLKPPVSSSDLGRQPLLLPCGEQVRAGVQGAAGGVERVAGATAVAVGALLDSSPAAVQGVAGEADDVEGIHHGGRVG